jgi:hypothetical protein
MNDERKAAEHTQEPERLKTYNEPWRVSNPEYTIQAITGDQHVAAEITPSQDFAHGKGYALLFMERLVECVNACADMHDPADQIAFLKRVPDRWRSLREWVDKISEMLRPGKDKSAPLNEERILELMAKEDKVEILQGGINEAQKFVQESEYFDGTAAGACVVKTAVEYGRRYKQRLDSLVKALEALTEKPAAHAAGWWIPLGRIERLLKDHAAPAPPPPDPVQGFKKLSEAAAGRFDGVDVEEYVRAVRYGEKPKRPDLVRSLMEFLEDDESADGDMVNVRDVMNVIDAHLGLPKCCLDCSDYRPNDGCKRSDGKPMEVGYGERRPNWCPLNIAHAAPEAPDEAGS